MLSVMAADRFGLLLLTIALFSLANSLLSPAISALTSKRTTLSQGMTMGVSNAFGSLGRIFGPALGGVLFDVSWSIPFLSAAGVMLIGYFVSTRIENSHESLQTPVCKA
ncbi:MAG: MFS transporter [Anaerolineales bacterium]|nr:MAG: MFS transporter [Anaerolineales bacterium]